MNWQALSVAVVVVVALPVIGWLAVSEVPVPDVLVLSVTAGIGYLVGARK